MPGVYISYPFCAQKCTFCNFASGVFSKDLEREYLEALRAEIGGHAWAWRPETVYLGGGTPSRIPDGELSVLLDALPGRPWTEATIEAAPGTVTAEKSDAWRAAGLTRVSLGAQSLVQAEIARTGRRHTPEVVAGEVRLLREAGIREINIDLIAGLPGQTAEGWRESLERLARLDPPHVSVYMLEVDEDSRLGAELLRGGSRYGAALAPSADLTADLYERAVEFLAGIGLARYEVSNFARPGHESRHNLKYWLLEPYAGFGADAHSFDGRMRTGNVESPREYVERHRKGEPPVAERSPADAATERFFIGLRLSEGIRPGPAEWRRFEGPIRRFLDDGLLATDGERLRLTSRGVMLSNEVLQEFVNV